MAHGSISKFDSDAAALVHCESLNGSGREALRRCGKQTPQGNVNAHVETNWSHLFNANSFYARLMGRTEKIEAWHMQAQQRNNHLGTRSTAAGGSRRPHSENRDSEAPSESVLS